MNARPQFKDISSFEEFSKYYWYREELKKKSARLLALTLAE